MTSSQLKITLPRHKINELEGFNFHFFDSVSRLLEGVYFQEVYFNLKNLAHQLSLTENELIEQLLKYEQNGWLEFKNGNHQTIQFIYPREENYLFHSLWKDYQKIATNKWSKLKELNYFIENKSYCRKRLLMGYFGEKKQKNCGRCDYCIENDPLKNSDYEGIYLYIKNAVRDRDDIFAEFHQLPKTQIIDILQLLLTEEKIKAMDYKTYMGL